MQSDTLPACTGPCQQGRSACPCPQACSIAADAAWVRFHRRMTRLTAAVLVVAILGTLYVVAV